jgi:hypothetical protein
MGLSGGIVGEGGVLKAAEVAARRLRNTVRRVMGTGFDWAGTKICVAYDDIDYHLEDKVFRRRYRSGSLVPFYPDLEEFSAFRKRDKKIDSVVLHFAEGVPWRDTPLFDERYRERLRLEGAVRGCRSLDELEEYYRRNYEPLYADIAAHGFRHAEYGKGIEPLYVHVSKYGELIWGSDGKHRLGMALALGFRWFPCRVFSRHAVWQKTRDALARDVAAGARIPERLAGHPDTQDIVRSFAARCGAKGRIGRPAGARQGPGG